MTNGQWILRAEVVALIKGKTIYKNALPDFTTDKRMHVCAY